MHRFLQGNNEFFNWLKHTWIGSTLARSTWGLSAVGTVHMIGLALLLGSMLVLNLSVLGFGLKRPADLAKDVKPYLWAGIGIMLCTGIPMFMSSPAYYVPNPVFRIKMITLAVAILLQVAVVKIPAIHKGMLLGKITAGAATLCWFTVAYAGRGIAFTNLFGF